MSPPVLTPTPSRVAGNFPTCRWPALFIFITLFSMGKQSAISQVKGHYDPSTQRFLPADPSVEAGPFVHGYAIVKQAGKIGVIRQDGALAMPIAQEVAILPIAPRPNMPPGSMPSGKATFGIIKVKAPDLSIVPNSICGPIGLGSYFLCMPDGRLVLPYLLIWSGTHQATSMYKEGGLVYFQLYDEGHPDDQLCQRCGLCLGYMGILNADGSMRIAPDKYMRIGDYHEGRAAVMNAAGKFGYVDAEGCEVIPCSFSEAGDFESGAAWVTKAGKRFRIGLDGKKLP